MRWLSTLVFALVTAAGISSASAATVSFAVTSQPTLDAIPLTYAVGGGASLDTGGAVPLVNMTITQVSPVSGGALYFMASSTVTAIIFGDTLEVTDFVLDSSLGLLFGDVTLDDGSGALAFANSLVGTIEDNGDVKVSQFLAGVLASYTRIQDAEGFIVANVTIPAPVPLPGALPLLAGALAVSALALRRSHRGRKPVLQAAV